MSEEKKPMATTQQKESQGKDRQKITKGNQAQFKETISVQKI